MGVSAVPGSGKTQTLSYLAATLVAKATLDDEQEILIVTLVNSAVDNFASRVGLFVQEMGLLPNFGYRVRTLHGLANDIVRERPALVGLADDFSIVDERESADILQDSVSTWIKMNPNAAERYLDPDLDDNRVQYILRDHWPDEITAVAGNFIRQAKDMQLEPDDVLRGLDRFGKPLPLAKMCHDIYVGYERSLSYRGAVDFQDLIRLALKALQDDADYLKRLEHRWPYILEDEAQDSSLLQEKILRLLSGEKGNWVRVGDPNQAIYETFTTAKPEYLRNFMSEKGVQARELPNSGRSTHSIIDLANYLIDWVGQKHPTDAIRQKPPLGDPKILPTPKGDPQPNPKDNPAGIQFIDEEFQPEEELQFIVQHAKAALADNPDQTIAILTPRNDRGAQMVKELKQQGVEVVELLRSTSSTRETAGALTHILRGLTFANASDSLSMAFMVWRREDRNEPSLNARLEEITRTLRKCKQVEDYVWPRAGNDWLDGEDATALFDQYEAARGQLEQFRALLQRWQEAIILPIDQLILTIAQDLFDTSADLAIAHALAVQMRHDADVNPHMRLPEFVQELTSIASNRRRVVDLGEDATGFDPDKHKGKVAVATMHRAKGLEWDRVYLASISTYDFPSAQPQDSFISEKWFVRDNLNLQAEALEQLNRLADPLPFPYEEGVASFNARIEYVSERLRLLYVGITRARKELIVTWNTGRQGKSRPSVPFIGLRQYWEGKAK